MNQRKYALELISDAGLLSCKLVSTPMDCKTHLKHDDGPLFEDVSANRRLIGRLLYLTTTRPDISFAGQQLSQYMSKPTIAHYNAALRVLRYLKASLPLVCSCQVVPLFNLRLIVLVIGLFALTQEDPLQDIVYILVPISSLGGPKSKALFLRVHVKSNTGLWLLLHVRYNG